MSPEARIALAIVTRDRPHHVARYVVPSLRGAPLERAEVVVIDQSRDDATAVLVADLPGVTYFRGSPGLSRGRNEAIAATTAPLLAFTDDDVSFPPYWLDAIADAFERSPHVGAVCGRGVDDRGRLLPGGQPGTHLYPTIPFALGSGFNMAFRRAALEAAGPFDERLGAGARFRAAEDSDMLYRVMRAGWSVVCRDDILVVHHGSEPETVRLALFRDYGIGAGAQTVKHLGAGDRTAARLITMEAGRHLMTIARSLIGLRPRMAALQVAWLGGLAIGLVKGFRELPRGCE
jgi:GT2 family glycosyltransferase